MNNIGLHIESPKENKYNQIQNDPNLKAMAFFLGSPMRWYLKKWNLNEINTFKHEIEKHPSLSIKNIVIHGCYLINPASVKPEVIEKSQRRFIEELQLCDRLGIPNYVFHPGCNKDTKKGLDMTIEMINLGLQESKNVCVCVENMTKTNTLCQTFKDINYVIQHITQKSRIGFCLDTAHCWGAGETKGMIMESLLDDISKQIGTKYLKVIHLNDSKVEYGANRDRHEDILKGKITKTFWKSFLTDSRIEEIPIILETPTNCLQTVANIINGKIDYEKKIYALDKSLNILNSSTSLTKEIEKFKRDDYLRLETQLKSEEWNSLLQSEYKKTYFKILKSKLDSEYKQNKTKIYPSLENTFRIFNELPISKIKVCILGQDPYHGKGQADGFSFSISKLNPKIPSSLKNIFKEIKYNYEGYKIPKHGCLEGWVKQGVFLLNCILSVSSDKKALSHKRIGWESFTNYVIQLISSHCSNVVFLLWGNYAKKKVKYIDENKHLVLSSSHPSGLSAHRGFFGCQHFLKCNQWLKKHNKSEIIW